MFWQLRGVSGIIKKLRSGMKRVISDRVLIF